MTIIETKPILDACCGGRMFWFNKQNPNATFIDIREELITQCDGRTFTVSPDLVADFTDLPFPDESFYHAVFDPPHLRWAGRNSYMRQHYGQLPDDWQSMIAEGFSECIRVLKPYGTLIFKWSEKDIPVKEILRVIGHEPLYGHKSGKTAKTHWLSFMKGVS